MVTCFSLREVFRKKENPFFLNFTREDVLGATTLERGRGA
jgi:hypothetical protein